VQPAASLFITTRPAMEDQYHHMPPHVGYYQHEQHNLPPQNFEHRVQRIQTMSSESLQYSDLDDAGQASNSTQGASKSKRRPVHGPDHIKHRRTRSGCFTCRQRRVKVKSRLRCVYCGSNLLTMSSATKHIQLAIDAEKRKETVNTQSQTPANHLQ